MGEITECPTGIEQTTASKESLPNRDLSQTTLEVANYVAKTAPQFDTNQFTPESQVNYYFAGSFAANLFSQITSFREARIIVTHNEKEDRQEQLTITTQEKIMPDKARGVFQGFTRKLGDFDIGIVNSDPYEVARSISHQNGLVSKQEIIQHVPFSIELFKGWKLASWGDPYDRVGTEHSSKTTNNLIIAEINDGKTNSEILLAHPSDMIAYKLIELLLMDRQTQIESTEENIKYTDKIEKDIVILYNGTLEMYGNADSFSPAFKAIATNMGYTSEKAPKLMEEKLNSVLRSKIKSNDNIT